MEKSKQVTKQVFYIVLGILFFLGIIWLSSSGGTDSSTTNAEITSSDYQEQIDQLESENDDLKSCAQQLEQQVDDVHDAVWLKGDGDDYDDLVDAVMEADDASDHKPGDCIGLY